MKPLTALGLLAAMALSGLGPATAQQRDLPPIDALTPNFYYDDVEAAKRWWVDRLGFRMMIDLGWVAIVELQPGMQIALVDGERGTLRAVEEKGALLVIETEALEAWYEHVAAIDDIDWYEYPSNPRRTRLPNGLMEHPEIHEFRIVDPGGYIIEFFRWKPEFKPR
jgi:hypothetical protein